VRSWEQRSSRAAAPQERGDMSKRAVGSNPEGQEGFEKGTEELVLAIALCLKVKLRTPALLLLYASIDIMGSLDRPESRPNVRFTEWADKYLLPDAGLACSAMDLWGARCGLLHTYISESDHSRQKKAREIYYGWDNDDTEYLQERIDHEGKGSVVVAVNAQHLFPAFGVGIRRFKQSLSKDLKKANLVYERASKFFTFVPKSSIGVE